MKSKKIWLSFLLGTIGVSSFLPVTLSNKLITSSKNSNSKYNYIYEGKQYQSIEEITKEYLVKNQPISSNLYIGNIDDSIFDYNNQMLNINKLRKFDHSKVFPAYKNAINEYTPNFNEAKKSFVNPGLIQYKYDDLNGRIFDSRDEAMDSILSSTFKNPIGYYEIQGFDSDIIKINPLNKDDVNFYKNFTMQTLFNKQQGVQKTELEIFDIQNPNNPIFSNHIDKFLENNKNNSESFNKIINDFNVQYKNLKNRILNNLKWDITLRLRTFGNKDIVQYKFKYLNDISYKKNEDNNIKLKVNTYNLRFENVSFKDLDIANVFANRTSFGNYNGINLIPLDKHLHKVAYQANLKIFGKNFDLLYTGKDKDEAYGYDIDILRAGTYAYEHRGVAFDLDLRIQNKNQKIIWIQQELQTFYNSFMTRFNNTNNSIKNNMLEVYFKNILSQYYNDLTNKPFKDFSKNGDLGKNEYYKFKNFSSFNDDPNISKTKINEQLLEYVLKPNLVINVNNHPTFMIKINNELKNNIEKRIKTISISGVTIKDIDKLNIKKVYFDALLEYWSNLNNIKKNEFVKNNMINVSNNFNKSNTSSIDISSQTFKEQKIISNSDKTLAYDFRNNSELQQESTIPNITMKSMDYKIDMALNQYNKTIKHYKLLNDPNFESINPNDILVLYNENASHKELMYSEFLSNKLNYNPSLFNSRINLYNDEAKINSAIVNNQKLKPAKIVVLYDLKGNIVNPGIALNEKEELLSTSDVIYDTEKNILDNLFRTKVILPDIDKKFFLNDNETYTLVKNQVDMIYELKLLNNKYYFKSFNDARIYLSKYLELKSQKVEVTQ